MTAPASLAEALAAYENTSDKRLAYEEVVANLRTVCYAAGMPRYLYPPRVAAWARAYVQEQTK